MSSVTLASRMRRVILVLAAAVVVAMMVAATPASAHDVTNNGFTLSNEATPDPATVGKQMTFIIMETNNSGSDKVFTVGISDFLPAGLRFASATVDKPGGMCSFESSTNTVNCKGFTIPNGQTATIPVVVIPTMTGSFTNHADDFGMAGPVDEPFMVKGKSSGRHKHNKHSHAHHKHH